jgi:hypothetical protein
MYPAPAQFSLGGLINQTCLPTAKEVAVLVIRFAFVDNVHLKVVLPQDDLVIDQYAPIIPASP